MGTRFKLRCSFIKWDKNQFCPLFMVDSLKKRRPGRIFFLTIDCIQEVKCPKALELMLHWPLLDSDKRTGKLGPAHTMPYTIPAITTPKLSRWKSHTMITEWQIHTQEHSWDRTTTILRSFAGVPADSTVAAGTAARTHCLGCCCCCYYFHSSVTYGPTLFIFIPLAGAADAASAVAVAAVGKITCACRHRRCGVGPSRWNINHAALRPRVLRVGTTSPVIIRTSNPLILDIPVSFGVSLWLSKQPHKLFNTIKIVRIIFTHHLLCGFFVQLPSIISAFGASCVPCTRVLGLESTDHAGPHRICALCVSAARQLTTAVPPSHIICAARTASSLCVDIRAD